MGKPYINLDEDDIIQSYQNLGSVVKVGLLFGVRPTRISDTLKHNNIPMGRGFKRLEDLSGRLFGNIFVLSKANKKCKTGKPRWLCVCSCGTMKDISAANLKSGSIVSCGCMRAKKGNHNRNWKGGITPQNTKIRNSAAYYQWRRTVYKRDDYRCRGCLSRNSAGHRIHLNAHHIESFYNNPLLRFEVSNGITLCIGCHSSFHKMYGNGSTSLQVQIFIEDPKGRLNASADST